MKSLRNLGLLSLLIGLFGCASTDRRIADNQALFDSYDVATQSMIRQGEIAIGFTPDQVRLALGDPDREATLETDSGKAILWQYYDGKPALGLSLGVGTGVGGRGSFGTGVGVGTGGTQEVEKSIVFDRETGNVSRIESYD